jgi:hypothetical protein
LNEEEEGLIAVIDILGTKGMWLRNNPKKVSKGFLNIINSINSYKLNIEDGLYGPQLNSNFKLTTYSFSDTIIVILTENSSLESRTIKNISEAIMLLGTVLSIVMAVAIEQGLYMRGSISFGTFYRDPESNNPIIIGRAIDEAAEWYDKAEIIGIYCSPSLKFLIDNIQPKEIIQNYCNTFFEYNVPLNNTNCYSTYLINWLNGMMLLMNNSSGDKINEQLQEERKTKMDNCKKAILNNFSKNPVGLKEYVKLKNTIDFCDEIIKS